MNAKRNHRVHLVLDPDESRVVQELLEDALDATGHQERSFVSGKPRKKIETIYKRLAAAIERAREKGASFT